MPPVFHFFLLSLLLSFFLFPSTLSRKVLPSSHETTILNVTASIKQAQRALSFYPKPHHHHHHHHIPTLNFFSLPLHPRLVLQKPLHKDYESLVLSRLANDKSRVKFLNDKLQLALNGGNNSIHNPNGELDLSVPLVSGLSQGRGEYFAQIGIGQPAQSFYMEPDTGSDINWLQCQPCQNCYKQIDPIFNPTSSSSFSSLSCSSQPCQSLGSRKGCSTQEDICLYQTSYGDHSFSNGELATELLSFGNEPPIPNVAIGCGHNNQGLFVGSAGLLGLGGGPLSLPSQIKATSFSYCLVNRDTDKSSTLDFNSAQVQTNGDSITAPLIQNEKFLSHRYIGVSGFSVGGEPISIAPGSFEIDESGNGGIILDSGTTVTYLKAQVYESLRDELLRQTSHLKMVQVVSQKFDTCYDLSLETEMNIPTVSIEFKGGKSLSLPPINFMVPVDTRGTFCFAFRPTPFSLSIIGNVQQQGIRVTYDLVNALVGFSSNQC